MLAKRPLMEKQTADKKDSMLRYVIHSRDIEQILGIVYDVLHIGVSFYDVDFNEVAFLDSNKHSPYCFHRRRDPEFRKACKHCDRKHFDKARQTGEIQVYRCHCGLYDGLVPLYDEAGHFLGGMIFGQVRPDDTPNPHPPHSQLSELYNSLPESSSQRMHSIGQLLKLTTELIVQKRMVEFQKLGWTEQIQRYIDAHINEKLTLSKLAGLIGKSSSFLRQHFQQEFGISVSQYIKKRRMEIAMDLLQSGIQVNKVADRLGFYDPYHFSKTFKAFYGKAPKEYRSAISNEASTL